MITVKLKVGNKLSLLDKSHPFSSKVVYADGQITYDNCSLDLPLVQVFITALFGVHIILLSYLLMRLMCGLQITCRGLLNCHIHEPTNKTCCTENVQNIIVLQISV